MKGIEDKLFPEYKIFRKNIDIFDYNAIVNDGTILTSTEINIDYTSMGFFGQMEYQIVLSNNG
jgi:hypothetical protein